MAEKQKKTQNQKRDDEILDLGSVELGQIQYHLRRVKHFNDAVFKKVKDDPDLVADAVNSKRVIDELLIKIGQSIERAKQAENEAQGSQTLGQILDEYISAEAYLEHLNNAMIALDPKESGDSSVVKLAAGSLGLLMLYGLQALHLHPLGK